LQDNQIEEINVNGLVDLKNLKELDLNNNKLKIIDVRCFEPLKSIAQITIYGNEFGLDKNKSFYNESWPLSDREIKRIKERLNKNGGYITEWKDFLKQFPE